MGQNGFYKFFRGQILIFLEKHLLIGGWVKSWVQYKTLSMGYVLPNWVSC